MSDRRRFLKGLTSLPLAAVLASPGGVCVALSLVYDRLSR